VGHVALQQLFFFLGAVVRHADHGLITSRCEGALHSFQQIDKQSVGEQRNEHHHVRTAAGGQGARGRVGHIRQASRRVAHAGHQVRRHTALADFTAQRAGRGDGTDTSGLRHITQRDAA
jgi:hypothetical protein